MTEQGLADPVFDSQRVFRALLAALAEPGRILPIEPCCIPPAGFDAAAVSIILALCDGDTPLWLGPSMGGAADFFRFHTGAPIVGTPQEAMFALADAAEQPPLPTLCAGTAEFPDRSATLVLAVAEVSSARDWHISGPGIAGIRSFRAGPVKDGFLAEWHENHARFPFGVDLLFAARDCVVGLPRSASLEA